MKPPSTPRTLPRPARFLLPLLALLATSCTHFQESTRTPTPRSGEVHDVVIYGGTSAAVIAAVQAKTMGKSVIVVSPDRHLGGLSSGGLGFTDTGDKSVIGGLARDFYHRVWRHYQREEAWRWQDRASYGNKGQGTPAIDGAQRTMWIFEPHVAEQVFEDLVREHGITVHRDAWLDRQHGVRKDGTRLISITTLRGRTYRGRMFIDATYEGDLMAASGVSYAVGREAQSTYGEQWNGVQTGVLHHRHHFGVLPVKISPYVIPGDPSSGVLPRISTEPPGDYGAADHRVQAYCYRMCLTDHPENRIPFPKPRGYDARQYELLLRVFAAGWRETFDKFDPIPNRKTDTNNHGPVSTDNIGRSYDYPEASYAERRKILREHETYQKGWLWFIANDPRVPAEVRDRMQSWGLSRDEFADNGHWPRQIYVREARRMVGHHVMTENELLKRRPTPESVGMGSYTIDSHNVQRYITPDGHVQNEGDIGVPTRGPYEIAYGSLVPQPGEADNLLVPICVSSSHIAFGSIRMEPVFMILAQSAATAAVLALDANLPVQSLPYATLRERLLADGQILQAPVKTTATPAPTPALAASPGFELLDTRVITPPDAPYGGWPTLALRRSGELWVVWSGGREAHVCPFGQVHAMTSRDQGRTWTWPRVLLDGPLDDRDAGVVETAAGALLVTTFTSLAYEPALNRAASTPGSWPTDRLARWQSVHQRLDAPARQRELGQWMIRSTDGGTTWSARQDCGANSPHGPVVLSGGRLLHAGKELWTGDRRTGFWESTDDGQTWRWLAALPVRPGDTAEEYHELHAVETPDRRLVVHIRNENKTHENETLQSESEDGGRTWTLPHRLRTTDGTEGVWGLPSHLLRLRDGRLLMTYGHRRAPPWQPSPAQ